VVENMPIGLVAIDGRGDIVTFNQAAEVVLQVSSSDAVGKNAGGVLPRRLWSVITERRSTNDIIQEEIVDALPNGRTISLEVSISPLEGEEGEFQGELVLFRDLTEIQNLKKEIERNQRLASLGRLAAGVAHEIRNPLSSIKGFATYFKERYKEIPEDKKTAEIMVQEVERLNRVIGQLLEFARPLTILRKPSPLPEVIEHSLKMIERDAQAKGIQIITSFASEITYVALDPDRINQVLLNLYLNAIEAMRDGGTLSVTLSRDERRQGAKITVSDTGIGIKQEDLIHIFDPYFTAKQSGTGLGLAIVHKTIEAHKGEVRVESEPGKGTTVTVVLPLSEGGSGGHLAQAIEDGDA
jgi:two-component system sensor histidine kinase HydH